jgi:tetratricopeptide (TPR) repeat protein
VETVAREITVYLRVAKLLLLSAFLMSSTPMVAWSDEASDAFDRLRQADEMWLEGRFGMAQKGYEELLSKYPTWWLPMLKMAILARDIGLQEKALALLKRCEELNPDKNVLQMAKRLFFDADSQRVSGDMQEDVRVLMAKAKKQERKKDFAGAIKTYYLILERCASCHSARFRLGVLLGEHGDAKSAEQLLEDGQERSLFSLRWKKAKKVGIRRDRKQ